MSPTTRAVRAMRKDEVYGLLRYCKALDPRSVVGLQDEEQLKVAVLAWYNELPVEMTVQDAQRCVHDLAAAGTHLTAQNIGRRFDELRTPKHMQGVTRSRRPGDPVREVRDVPALPEPEPLSGVETSRLLDELGLRDRRRAAARKVRCPHCGVGPGRECVSGTGEVLRRSPAHPSRFSAAGVDAPLTPV